MAFYDWNRDGKKDIRDDFIEYNICEQSSHNNNTSSYSEPSSNDNSGCLALILFFGIVLLIAFVVTRCTTSYCALDECAEECTEGSRYCLVHDYGSSEYHNDKSYYRHESEKETEEKSEYLPSTKNDDEANYKPHKGKNADDDDPYNVNDYSTPEDFYYDNYDDFWDYEDAEDYYNENHEKP